MNELQVFDYNNKMVRTIEQEGELWWVLKDVCKVLKMTNHKMVIQRLDADEVGKFNIPHPQNKSRDLEVVCINESGLYNVILRSDKPEAKPFRKWVTSEVLPTIRKTGNYSIDSHADTSAAIDVLKGFLQTQQQQFSILMQNQQSQVEQLTALANLITSMTPPQYKPPFTRWMDKALKKVDIIANATGVERRQMLHRLYNELQYSYDIDLDEYLYEFCYNHGISNTGLYTLNAIGADTELKKLFDLMVDTYIEQCPCEAAMAM